MMTDPIADMLTRLRNANSNHSKSVTMPASRVKVGIAQVLKEEGFIRDYTVEPAEPASVLRIGLNYGPDGENVIRKVERVSKPGLRIYKSKDDIPRVMNGLGVAILSTSRGVMTDRKARADGVGGEVLCIVA